MIPTIEDYNYIKKYRDLLLNYKHKGNCRKEQKKKQARITKELYRTLYWLEENKEICLPLLDEDITIKDYQIIVDIKKKQKKIYNANRCNN